MSKIKGMLSKVTINPANFSGLIEEDISKLVETLKYYTVNLIVLEATGG
jgi:transposase